LSPLPNKRGEIPPNYYMIDIASFGGSPYLYVRQPFLESVLKRLQEAKGKGITFNQFSPFLAFAATDHDATFVNNIKKQLM
jgi:hypothetical protein